MNNDGARRMGKFDLLFQSIYCSLYLGKFIIIFAFINSPTYSL